MTIFGQDISSLSVLSVGALFGGIWAAWGQLKGIFTRFSNLIIVTESLAGKQAFRGLKMYLSNNYTIPPTEKRYYGLYLMFKKNSRTREQVPVILMDRPMFLRKGFKLIYLNIDDSYDFNVSYLRWTYPKHYFVNKAKQFYENMSEELESVSEEELNSNLFVSRKFFGSYIVPVTGSRNSMRLDSNISGKKQSSPSSSDDVPANRSSSGENSLRSSNSKHEYQYINGDKANDFLTTLTEGTEDCYILSDTAKHAWKDFDTWAIMENWYRQRGISWKRGWLIHGPPGTGKTAFVRWIGSVYKIPIIRFDLASMTNEDLIKSWDSEVISRSPCIVLFEDIDSVFNGRVNTTSVSGMTTGVTFDALLNVLDGISASDGVFTIMTTNDMSKIDTALAGVNDRGEYYASRPGRIDEVLLFDSPTKEMRLAYATRVMDDANEQEISKIVDDNLNCTMAQFQNICIRRALEKIYNQKRIVK